MSTLLYDPFYGFKATKKNITSFYSNKIKQKIQTYWRLLFISISRLIMFWCNDLSPTDAMEKELSLESGIIIHSGHIKDF